jgi:hypothetical protein
MINGTSAWAGQELINGHIFGNLGSVCARFSGGIGAFNPLDDGF